MAFHRTRRIARAIALASLFLTSTVVAQLATTPTGREVRMLDARVNLHSSYNTAIAARPGTRNTIASALSNRITSVRDGVSKLRRTTPGAKVTLSALTTAPAQINNPGGWLSAGSGRTSEAIARQFLSDNAGLFGLSAADMNDLVVLGDSKGGRSGLRMVRMEQQVDGVPVFQSESRFTLSQDGHLAKYVGQIVPAARASVVGSAQLGAADALVRLMGFEGKNYDAAAFAQSAGTNDSLLLTKSDEYIAGDVTARRVLFPISTGVLVPAWSLVVFTTGDQDWYAIVDAQTGAVLWRKGIRAYASAHDARFRVYVQADGTTPADSPSPLSPTTVTPGSGTQPPAITPTIVSMHLAYDPVASPNGWIDDCPAGGCTANETQTLGNNVLACMDITQGANANICDTSAAGVLDGNGRPTGNPDSNSRNRDFLGTTPRDFETNFLPPPQGGNPEAGQTATGNGNNGTLPIDQFRRGLVTHLFYSINWYHDKLYQLGFDEASANFQRTNFSGMGVGNDRVLVDADDGSGTNNSNFSTPPDGTSGRMQMYRFTGPTIDRDGGLDAEIFFHEATHGLSNRLVGNAAGLNWDPGAGMGEGWSDFVALSLLNNTNADDPNANYSAGGYATYKILSGYTDNYLYGIRRFPYSTDNSVNPMTWADVDDVTNDLSGGIAGDPNGFNLNGGAEVHNIGEIWALTLWEVRSRIIAAAGGDVPTGNQTTLQLIVDGLKMTPIDPGFIEARDAILDADCATNLCINEESIWGGFADRGLGYGAAEPYRKSISLGASHVAVHESFVMPHLDVADPASDVAIDDSASNNNGNIDPGEAVRLTVRLTNPWRAASKAVTSATATLTTSTPGVTIYTGTSAYGAIPASGSATGAPFLITVDPSVPCGSSIDFTLSTTSDLGTASSTFS
ncbi:MAG TPA: M36 family metallopeptidase, partial [Rudaea sp.]